MVLDAGAALAIVAAYLTFASFDGSDGSPVFTGPMWLGWATAACVGLPIAVRRLWPLPVAAIVVIGCVASSVLDIAREPFVPAALALYAVGSLEARRRSVAAVVVALIVLSGGLVVGTSVITPSETYAETVLLVGAVGLIVGGGWAAGLAMRHRRFAADRDPPAHPRIQPATPTRELDRRESGPPDGPGTRSPTPYRYRLEQRRTRGAPAPEHGNRQDPHWPAPCQTQCPGPGPARHCRLRERCYLPSPPPDAVTV
jgi:hypothetical protein